MRTDRGGVARRAWRSGLPRILTGSVVGQGAVLAASPIVTRLYQPSDFGALAVVTGVSAVVAAVSTLGIERAVPVPRGRTAARVLVATAGIALVVSAALTAVLVGVFRDGLSSVLSVPALTTLWWIIPVAVAAIGAQRIVTAVLTRRRDHGALGRRNAVQGLVQVSVSMVLAPTGSVGLVVAPSVGRLAASIGTVRLRGPRTVRSRGTINGRIVRATIGRFRRFLWAAPLSALLNVSGQQLPTLLIAASQGATVAGFIGLAVRVLAAPVGVLCDAVGQWFAGRLAASVRERADGVLPLVLRTSLRMAVPAAAGALVTVLAAPSVFTRVFGEEWHRAGEFAQLLVVLFAVQLAVSPVSHVLPLLERQVLQLAWDGGRVLLVVGGTAAAIALGLGAVALISTYVALSVTAYAVLWVLVATAARRHDALVTDPRTGRETPCLTER